MPITVRDQHRVEITTPRLQAVFSGASLLSLKNAAGQPLLAAGVDSPPAFEIQFAGGGSSIPLGAQDAPQCFVQVLGDNLVHIHIEDNEADACLRITTDAEGRIRIEPSVDTLRPGLGILRFNFSGIAREFKLVAPLYQGCKLELESPLLAPDRYPWPHMWEAPLAILQGPGGGWSVSCHDRLSRPKALSVGHPADPRTLGFETEAFGPWDRNTAVGSLTWIIDAHEGDWTVPAQTYRQWLERTYDLARLAAQRPGWIREIRLTVQGCPCRLDILEELARLIDPRRVLIETSKWRTDDFDTNYPEYVASDAGRAFLQEAVRRGYRIMPYFNFQGCDPTHPVFASVSRYATRDPSTRRLLGWRHDGKQCRDFPQGQGRLHSLKERTGHTELAYIHPGSSVWRRELGRRIADTVREFNLTSVFVDQTLATTNVDNGLVENLSPSDGMIALTRELAAIGPEMAIGGEGLNEMSMQHLAFAQAHLFKSWHANHPHLTDLEPVPLGALLYGDVCLTMGYIDLAGETPAGELRLELHEKLGALPSLRLRDGNHVKNLSPAARRVLDRALA
jgi:hypothetical protein